MVKDKDRILFIITSFTKGGAEKQLFNIALGLKDKFEIKVLGIQNGPYYKLYKQHKVNVKFLSNDLKYTKLLNNAKKIEEEIDSFKPKIIHSFISPTNILIKFILLSKKKDFKLVCGYRFIISKLKHFLYGEKINSNVPDVLIPNSKAVYNDMVQNKLNTKKTLIIENGIENFNLDKSNISKLKKEFKNKKIILTVANFKPEKDYETNLKVCKELTTKRDNFYFLYVGYGPLENKIRKKAKKMNLDKIIFFLGKREDIGDLLQISSIFFMPSTFEGQSNALMEAMMMKVPIVTTKVPGSTKLVKNGFFSEVGNYKKMAKDINQILDRGYDKKKLSENYEIIKKNHSMKTMIRKYYKVYKDLLK